MGAVTDVVGGRRAEAEVARECFRSGVRGEAERHARERTSGTAEGEEENGLVEQRLTRDSRARQG
jgi:hypothetical protein